MALAYEGNEVCGRYAQCMLANRAGYNIRHTTGAKYSKSAMIQHHQPVKTTCFVFFSFRSFDKFK